MNPVPNQHGSNPNNPLGSTSGIRHLAAWVALGLALLVAAFFWTSAATELVLSFTPTRVWAAIALLWVEIAALGSAWVLRYRCGWPDLALSLALAWAIAVLNLVFAILVAPII